jgi:hypothetical protein
MGVVGRVQRGILAALDSAGYTMTRRQLAQALFGNTDRPALVSTRRAMIDLWRRYSVDCEYQLIADVPGGPQRWHLTARSRAGLRSVAE